MSDCDHPTIEMSYRDYGLRRWEAVIWPRDPDCKIWTPGNMYAIGHARARTEEKARAKAQKKINRYLRKQWRRVA